jgi:hypothetical protein
MALQRFFALPFLAVILASPLAHAESMPTSRDITSVRSAGMGDATRGFASSGEALWENPAGISANTRFNADLQAMFEPVYNYRLFTVSSIDSKLNAEDSFPLAGGLGYSYYRSGEGDAERHGSIATLGLSLPLLPDTFFIGATGKYLHLGGAVDANAVTLDAGVMLRPISSLGISAVGYNLIDVDSPEAKRSWAFGAAFGDDRSLHVDVDALLDKDAADKWTVGYRAGAEYLIAGLVMPRVGFIEDPLRDVRKLTGGLSLIIETLAIEAAYQHELNGKGQFFGIGLRLLDAPLGESD